MALTVDQNSRILTCLIEETGLQPRQVENTVALFQEGATVPFIARYRKERTGELDEVQVRLIEERLDYFRELEERKATVLASIEEQGKLTAELRGPHRGHPAEDRAGRPLSALTSRSGAPRRPSPGSGAWSRWPT